MIGSSRCLPLSPSLKQFNRLTLRHTCIFIQISAEGSSRGPPPPVTSTFPCISFSIWCRKCPSHSSHQAPPDLLWKLERAAPHLQAEQISQLVVCVGTSDGGVGGLTTRNVPPKTSGAEHCWSLLGYSVDSASDGSLGFHRNASALDGCGLGGGTSIYTSSNWTLMVVAATVADVVVRSNGTGGLRM